jgi:hypothetical protein
VPGSAQENGEGVGPGVRPPRYMEGEMRLGTVRNGAYALARALGDYQAIRNGRVGRRILRRMAGRATGRILGRLFR